MLALGCGTSFYCQLPANSGWAMQGVYFKRYTIYKNCTKHTQTKQKLIYVPCYVFCILWHLECKSITKNSRDYEKIHNFYQNLTTDNGCHLYRQNKDSPPATMSEHLCNGEERSVWWKGPKEWWTYSQQ